MERDYVGIGVVEAFPSVTTKAITEQRVTQSSRTYTTAYEYHESDFGDYHRPWKIVETGDKSRETTREFEDDVSIYVLGLVRKETTTVGGESFVVERAFDSDTGFMDEELGSVSGRGSPTTATGTWARSRMTMTTRRPRPFSTER